MLSPTGADSGLRRSEPAAVKDPLPSAFRQSLRRYLAAQVSARDIEVAGAVSPTVIRELAELGVFGVNLPAEYGGSDLGLAGACNTVEELARADRSVATTVGLHLGLGTRGLVAFGSEEQKKRWLPGLAAGANVSAFATTEPSAGSDLSRLSTVATGSGDKLNVNGRKIYVTNGGLADLITITASTPGLGGASRGQSLLVLERGDSGLEFGAEEHKLGLRASSTVSLYFDGLEVPLDRVLGKPGEGASQLLHVLAFGRTIMSAGCLGTARAAFEATWRHTAERRQFGSALIDLPVVRAQVAEMRAGLFAMEALVAATADLEQDRSALERLSLSTKVFCSELDWEICDRALQLHGGSGYIEETGVAILLRDARITRIFEGANDVLLSRIGMAELVSPVPTPSRGGATAELAAAAAGFRAELKAALGLKALRSGELMHRLGRLVVWLDAIEAVERRAEALGSEDALAWARIIARRALSEARQLVSRGATPADESDVEAALQGEFT